MFANFPSDVDVLAVECGFVVIPRSQRETIMRRSMDKKNDEKVENFHLAGLLSPDLSFSSSETFQTFEGMAGGKRKRVGDAEWRAARVGLQKRVTLPSKKEIDGRWLEGSPMPSLFLVFSDTQTSKDRREKLEVSWTGVLLGNRRYVRSDDTEIAVTQPTLIGRLVIGWILGSGAYYFFFLQGNWFNRG